MCKGAIACMVVTILIMLFILCLLFIPMLADAGEIHGNVEFGRDPETPNAYAEIEISFDFDLWVFQNSIYGGWLTWFTLPDDGLVMKNVLYDLYTFGYKIFYHEFYIDFNHYCRHPEELNGADVSISTIAVGVKF